MIIANGLAIICHPFQDYLRSPDKAEAVGTVLNSSLPFLKSDECERLRGQLSYIVQYMKEKSQHPQILRFRI